MKAKRTTLRWDRITITIGVIYFLVMVTKALFFTDIEIERDKNNAYGIVEMSAEEQFITDNYYIAQVNAQNTINTVTNPITTTSTFTTTTTTTTTTTSITTVTAELEKTNGTYSSRLNRYMTDYEMYLLKMICASESGLEIFEGKVAVVANILNRMEDSSGLFADTVYGVIFQPYQYSSAKNGRFYNSYGEIFWEDLPESMQTEIEEAVLAALAGEDPTKEALGGGSLFFYNPDYCSEEELKMRENIEIVFRIGNHIFYRVW